MGKYRMPTFKQFIEKKIIYGPKRDPVWIYIEKEMLINIGRKPYNEKVGKWLRFLRDLRHFFHLESKRQLRILLNEVGPPWYVELGSYQKELLGHLADNIKADLIEDCPARTRKCLSDLGITIYIPNKIMLKAMDTCTEDPGIFIWNLYTEIYKQSPSELRGEYDMNAMILMSTLVFIDLEECIRRLDELTASPKERVVVREKKKKKYFEPNVKFGVYLQRMYAPLYCNHPDAAQLRRSRRPKRMEHKIRIRSTESYEKLCKDTKFLRLRLERNRKQKRPERICNYKFWEPPSTLRNTNPKMVEYANKLRVLKKRPKVKHIGAYEHMTFNVGPVTLVGSHPRYLLNTVAILPTGYIPINSGFACLRTGEYVTIIAGYWISSAKDTNKCDSTCSCLEKWEAPVISYLKKTKCMCHHLYDFGREGKSPEKYFHQPTKHIECWMDTAKIYQIDPVEDFIKDTVQEAVQTREPSPEPSLPSCSASDFKESELLESFLADLSDSPLLIPHLPQAYKLNNLQEWVRKRVKGKIDPALHKQLLLRSLRRWVWLKHMDFRMRPYRIPFTLKQLHHMNWSHRRLVGKLFKVLLNNFVTRNRLRQLEQTRLWWSTMKYDMYPGKPFLDIYFTYMPGRMKDIYLINPFNSVMTPKYGAKTCPLNAEVLPLLN